MISKLGLVGVLGITDRDFDGPEQVEPRLDEIHMHYEDRDLEGMLIHLGVLALVLEHIGSAEKLAAAGGAYELIGRFQETLRPVTRMRLQNARSRWSLAFDGVDLAGKIDRKSLELKLNGYCEALRRCSSDPAPLSELLAIAGGRRNRRRVRTTWKRSSSSYGRRA